MSLNVYNFSAGPAALPQEVLIKAQAEFTNYNGTGLSIMEMSHRGKEFMDVLEKTISLIKELMSVPNHYKIILTQGGASAHFAMLAMNLKKSGISQYIDTGVWSTKAIKEAERFSQVNVIASSADQAYSYIPEIPTQNLNPQADYLHITTNNTIYGTCYSEIPDSESIPLIADMSSDILSKPYDVEKFGMIYAGAQKNIGPSGIALCIIREDLLERSQNSLPQVFNYKKIYENNSMYNTPNTFGIYMCQLTLDWLKSKGGAEGIHKENIQKANLLYNYLDSSHLFTTKVLSPHRSIMNIPFTTENHLIDTQFINEAQKHGLLQLKGHRITGGMRASIYNAMPIEGVKTLVDFMKYFEEKIK